jgi:hypothetical protein
VVVTIDFKDGDGDLGEVLTIVTTHVTIRGAITNCVLLEKPLVISFKKILAANSKLFSRLKTRSAKGAIEGKLDYADYFPYSECQANYSEVSNKGTRPRFQCEQRSGNRYTFSSILF